MYKWISFKLIINKINKSLQLIASTSSVASLSSKENLLKTSVSKQGKHYHYSPSITSPPTSVGKKHGQSPSPASPPSMLQGPVRCLGHHWGVRAQILGGICLLCNLQLTLDAMVNVSGLTVFSCGHAYHTICLAQHGRFCIVCRR